jgi:hypothetical protein
LASHANRRGAADARWYVDRLLIGLMVVASLAVDYFLVAHYLGNAAHWFSDGELYWRATDAWIRGANPWQVEVEGIRFAGIPPTLLANVPLMPFGAEVARPFWACAGLAAWFIVLWRLRLPIWWFPFSPFVEAWLAGSPDITLLCLIVLGWGAVAAAIKPYSIPGMLAAGRWRAVALGLALVIATVPVLQWANFLKDAAEIRATLEAQALHLSSWGNWPWWVLSAVALVSLGPRLALGLSIPVLAPAAQLHYALFSVEPVRRSTWFGLVLTIPGAAPVGVVLFAAWIWATRLVRAAGCTTGQPGIDSSWSPFRSAVRMRPSDIHLWRRRER